MTMKKTMLLMTMLMLMTPLTGCLEGTEPLVMDETGDCVYLDPGR